MSTVVVETVMDLTGPSDLTKQVPHLWEVHNLHPITKVTMLTDTNHTVLGVQVEMDLSMVTEVLEVVKVL